MISKEKIVVSFGLVVIVTLFSTSANASRTMSLVDEYRDGGEKVCVYSDGRNSDEVRKSLAGACPSKHISR